MNKPLHPDVKFLTQYYDLALGIQHKYGVPALVALSQHIWEGGRESKNKLFNIFGIKPWKGSGAITQVQRTWEVHDTPNVKYPKIYSVTKRADGKYHYDVETSFEGYPSVAAAYDAYGRFLSQNARYRPAFAVRNDAEAFARAVAKAGYATDPDYANKLVTMIRQLKKHLPTAQSLPAAPLASAPSAGEPQPAAGPAS